MKEKKIKISVITTYYNDENTILYAIESVHSQILTDDYEIEHVIVNDCSTDNSETYVNKYLELKKFVSPNIIYKHVKTKKNLGCGGARKFGISKGTGQFFMFLDADDYYMNTNFVFNAANTIINENADIVEYGIKFNYPDGTSKYLGAQEKIIIENNKKYALELLFNNGIIRFNVWSKIYTKQIVKSYPYSTERTYEDIRTIPYWVSNANKIIIIPTAEINYRANENSIIRTNKIETRLGTVKALCELMDTMPEECRWDIYERALIDLTIVLHGHTSNDEGFNEMSQYNTKMLSKLMPDKYKDITYNIEDEANK